MATFAVVNKNIVENIAVAEAKIVLELILPKKQIIQETVETGIAWIGSEVIDGKFKPPQPYPSWSFDASLFAWVAPTPEPNDGFAYYWDETSQDWIELVLPTDSEGTAEAE